MHDLSFDHQHMDAEQVKLQREFIERSDNIELTTVGVDIGSTTSHLSFSRLLLHRPGNVPTSRFTFVDRTVIWRSEIVLTPYLTDGAIDAAALTTFMEDAYAGAGLLREQVDSGAVLLTGAALEQVNARAIGELFSRDAGKFVCTSAGHNLECMMAAHGSGAIALSARRQARILNIDIGGGTAKFALVHDGVIQSMVAIAAGARVIAFGLDGRIARVSWSGAATAEELGIPVEIATVLTKPDREKIAARFADILLGAAAGRTPDPLTRKLLLTDYWPQPDLLSSIEAITFSGGVAEYLFGREDRDFGDLGKDLAEHIRQAAADKRIPVEIWDPGEGIRATVTGAAQFSTQVSGKTILVPDQVALPIENLPAVFCHFDLSESIAPEKIEVAICEALKRMDFAEGSGPVALAFQWQGDPSYRRFAAVAEGIARALPKTIAQNHCIVLLIDGDVAQTMGNILQSISLAKPRVVAIDGVQLRDFDYVDIGTMLLPAGIVPVIVKTLMF